MGAKKVDFDQAGRTPAPDSSIAKRSQQAESADLSQSSPATASQPENNHIYLIGSAMAQSKLLANHIEQNTGFSCFLAEDFEELGQSIEHYDDSVLLMRDCYRKSNDMILAELKLEFQEKMFGTLFCLINLKESSGLELEALECGVKGFFYEHEPLEKLVKGIYCIFKGEIWLNRMMMSEYINNKNGSRKSRRNTSGDVHLTQREFQILSMLSSGYSNEAIAEKRCISLYTVKKHVYNIYKKIDVTDRIQAALWAAKNL